MTRPTYWHSRPQRVQSNSGFGNLSIVGSSYIRFWIGTTAPARQDSGLNTPATRKNKDSSPLLQVRKGRQCTWVVLRSRHLPASDLRVKISRGSWSWAVLRCATIPGLESCGDLLFSTTSSLPLKLRATAKAGPTAHSRQSGTVTQLR